MKSDNKIAAILKDCRKKTGLSGKQIVAMLKERGIDISEKTLLGYENGVGTPRVSTFFALCDIYKISNIMKEFGYSTTVKLATGDSEWSFDLYNDFFNASLLEKIYILLREGVPSFAGYEEQLEKSLPSDAAAANFDRLYKLFLSLDEAGQGTAFRLLEELVNQRNPSITEANLNRFLISASSNSAQKALKTIAPILNQLNVHDIEFAVRFIESLPITAKPQIPSAVQSLEDKQQADMASTPTVEEEADEAAAKVREQYISERGQESPASSANGTAGG